MKLKIVTQDVCAGCRMLENYMENEHEEVEVEYLDISKEPQHATELGVMSTPTTILWDPELDEEVSRHTGFQAGEDEEYIYELIQFVE